MYGSTISFIYFQVFFLKIAAVKNFSLGTITSPFSTEGSIAPMYTKKISDLTIAIINKCIEFQNHWPKIICIRYNGMPFCPKPLC